MTEILHINSNYYNSKLHKMLLGKIQAPYHNSIAVPVKYNTEIKEADEDNDTRLLPCFNSIDRFFYHHKQTKIQNALEDSFDVQKFALIHTHLLFSNGNIAYHLKKKYGIPYITTVRNTDLNAFYKYYPHLRKLGADIMLNSEKIIFLSEVYKDRLFNRYLKKNEAELIEPKTLILGNGIDPFWHENLFLKKDPITPGKNAKLIFVGALAPWKNVSGLLESCKCLIKRGWNVSLTVIGSIQNQNIYKQVMSNSFAHYKPYMKKEDLIMEYRKNDIFVMPSLNETFGLVYAEAMSQGLPVIYTENEGFDRQFAEGMVGYHVKSNDSNDIADGIEKIYMNYDEIAHRCPELSMKFNWDIIGAEYKKIYEEILSSN